MSNNHIAVKIDVNQVIDGRKYTGYLELDKLGLKYEAEFGFHLDELEKWQKEV